MPGKSEPSVILVENIQCWFQVISTFVEQSAILQYYQFLKIQLLKKLLDLQKDKNWKNYLWGKPDFGLLKATSPRPEIRFAPKIVLSAQKRNFIMQKAYCKHFL